MTAQTVDRVYAKQIVTRHGTGSKLVTDQGRNFMSEFFKETCKILGVHKIHTTSFHPMSNGQMERFHRSLHAGLSHYVNATHTNWDVLVQFDGLPGDSKYSHWIHTLLSPAWERDAAA